jgi:hypothetical protein
MKLLIMQFPLAAYHFITFRSRYSQHPVLKPPQSMFFRDQVSHPYQKHRLNYTLLYSNFYDFGQQTRSENVLDWMAASIIDFNSNIIASRIKFDWFLLFHKYLPCTTFSKDFWAIFRSQFYPAFYDEIATILWRLDPSLRTDAKQTTR